MSVEAAFFLHFARATHAANIYQKLTSARVMGLTDRVRAELLILIVPLL